MKAVSIRYPGYSSQFRKSVVSIFFFLTQIKYLLADQHYNESIKTQKEGSQMSNQPTFTEVKEALFPTLEQYVPIVARVHGKNHPEFHDVHQLFNAILEKTLTADTKKPDLNEEFIKLRAVANNYTVPDDVCESYEAVYQMLAKVDQAYQASLSPRSSRSI